MNQEYVLGQSVEAARRLDIQDEHFAETSEKLLDELRLRPGDRVVELGCGVGSFSRRILRRLGEGCELVGVDRTPGLLGQARARLANIGPARFESVQADVSQLGLAPAPLWLAGVTVVAARAVLHHVPMVEFMLGRLCAQLPPGTRLGFIEPDFRGPLAQLAHLEATGRPELAPLRTWAVAINELYLVNRISPAVGATLGRALELAGCRNVQSTWAECRSDNLMLDNMVMFYEEVRDRLDAHGILSAAEVTRQQQLLRGLPLDNLPAVWGSFRVTAET